MNRFLKITFSAALVLGSISIFGSATAQEAPLKLAVVDTEAVITSSAAGRALAQELQNFRQQNEQQLGARREALVNIQNQLAEGANSLPSDRIQALQQQLETGSAELNRLIEDVQRQGQVRQNQGLEEIERQLQPVFDAIQAEAQYDIIFNKAAGSVLLAGDRVDITALVIQRFDESFRNQ